MRVAISFVGLLVLPLVVGCEGNTPRRSPFAAPSTPTAAKTVEFAPVSKNAVPVNRPAGQGNVDNNPGANPPAPAANPGNQQPVDADKISNRREDLMYHTAVFLRREIGGAPGTNINENNNFVFRPAEGLDKIKIIPAMSQYVAEKGKAPPTIKEFLAMLQANAIDLPQLKPNEYYIYDPEQVKEANKEEMLYLQQFP